MIQAAGRQVENASAASGAKSPEPVLVTTDVAAGMLGISRRTFERYKADLIAAGLVRRRIGRRENWTLRSVRETAEAPRDGGRLA